MPLAWPSDSNRGTRQFKVIVCDTVIVARGNVLSSDIISIREGETEGSGCVFCFLTLCGRFTCADPPDIIVLLFKLIALRLLMTTPLTSSVTVTGILTGKPPCRLHHTQTGIKRGSRPTSVQSDWTTKPPTVLSWGNWWDILFGDSLWEKGDEPHSPFTLLVIHQGLDQKLRLWSSLFADKERWSLLACFYYFKSKLPLANSEPNVAGARRLSIKVFPCPNKAIRSFYTCAL